MDKLSLQWEKKRERKAKASSSSLSGFSPSMPVPLGQLQSSVGSDMVTTTSSSLVCAVTFSTAASIVSATLFVSPAGVTSVELSRKRRRVEFPREREKMLAAFEELWASGRSSSPRPVCHLLPSHQWLRLRLLSQLPSHLRSPLRFQMLRIYAHGFCPLELTCVSGHGLIVCLDFCWFPCSPCRSRLRLPGVPDPINCLVPSPVFRQLTFGIATIVVRAVMGKFPPLFRW